MLNLLLGRAKSGRTRLVVKKIGENIARSERAILIVPDQETFLTESRLLRENELKGLMGTEVLSFNRFCQRVIKWSGAASKVRLDDTGRSMLLAGAVMQCADRLKIFSSCSGQPAFIDKLSRMIAVFKGCGLTPEHVEELALKASNGLLKAKLTDAAVIYAEYERLTEGKYTDTQDHFILACLLADKCPQLKQTWVYIDGFEVFTQKMLQLIETLAKIVPELCVSLPASSDGADGELYALSENACRRIVAMAKDKDIPYRLHNISLKSAGTELTHMADNLFAYPHKAYMGQVRNITLFEAKNPEEEVRRAAYIIREAALSGARYRDFAVISGSPSVYTPLIDRIFRQYEIPVFADIKRPVPAQPLARLILALLNIKEQGMKNMLEYAGSPLMGFADGDYQSLSRMVREAGIKRSEFYSGRADRLDKKTKEEFMRLREVFLPPAEKFEAAMRPCRRIEQYARAITLFLEEQKIAEALDKEIKILEEAGLPSQADEAAQMWELTVNLFEQLNELLGTREVSRGQFAAMLASGFSQSAIGVIPSTVDCVLLGDFERTKTGGIKTAFILGANEGILPAPLADEGLLSGRELSSVNEMGASLEPDLSMQISQQNYDIYSAFLSPSESLNVSYSLASDEGAGLRPSNIVSRLRLIFPRLALQSGLEENAWLETPASGLSLLFASVRGGVSDKLGDFLLYLKRHGSQGVFESLERALTPAKRAAIYPENAEKLFFGGSSISVSRLETQAQCPYMHFVNYGLRPERSEEYGLSARDTGSLLHEIMELCLAELSGRDLKTVSRAEIFERVDRLLAERAPQYRFGFLASSNRARRQAGGLAVTARIAVYEAVRQLAAGHFVQAGREIVFDTGRDYPPIILPTKAGELKLRGVVDRADVLYLESERYIRIVDYKSGANKFVPERVADGTLLQLPLYMDAALSAFRGAKAAGAFYFHIKELEGEEKILLSGPAVNIPEVLEAMDQGIYSGSRDVLEVKNGKTGLSGKNLLTPKGFEKLISLAKDKAGELASFMAAGRIEAAPIDYGDQETPCRYCEHYLLCGIKEKGAARRRACEKLELE